MLQGHIDFMGSRYNVTPPVAVGSRHITELIRFIGIAMAGMDASAAGVERAKVIARALMYAPGGPEKIAVGLTELFDGKPR